MLACAHTIKTMPAEFRQTNNSESQVRLKYAVASIFELKKF